MDRAKDREWMRVVYLALVRDSLVPCDAATVGRSAVAAIARRGGAPAVTLPPDFGADVERDAAFLVEALPVEGPWWDVFAAMAWDAGVAHTTVTDGGFASGMVARLRGEPFAAPGFFPWRQSDSTMAASATSGSAGSPPRTTPATTPLPWHGGP